MLPLETRRTRVTESHHVALNSTRLDNTDFTTQSEQTLQHMRNSNRLSRRNRSTSTNETVQSYSTD